MTLQQIIAGLRVKPEHATDFEKNFADNAKTVYDNEPGCLLYQLCKDAKDPGSYVVLEMYKDEDAVKTHMAGLKARPAEKNAPGSWMEKGGFLHIMPVFSSPVHKQGADDATVAIFAEIPADPDNTDGFEKATQPVFAEVNSKEEGCKLYSFGKHRKQAGVYMVMELYKDMASVGAHGKMDHFKAMGRAQKPFMAKDGKLAVKILQTVGKSHSKAPAAKM